MPNTQEAARPPLFTTEPDSALDAIMARRRELTIGLGVIAVLGVTIMLWRQGTIKKEARAEQALAAAASSMYGGGDIKKVQEELQKVVTRYKGTNAGTESALLLAQSYFQGGKLDDGIKVLQEAKKADAGPFAASIDGLIAAGYADQKKYDESSKAYLSAADKARFPADQDMYRAEAARVLMVAGKKDEAKKIWSELASKPDSPVMAEAKIRLGEIEAAAN